MTVLAFWTTVSGSIARVAPGRRTRVASRGASELTLRFIIGLLLIAVLFFDIRSLRGIRSALWLTEAALWSIVAGSISRVAPGRRTSMESGATVGARATLLKLWASIRARARLRASKIARTRLGTSEGTGTSETSRSVVRILNLLGIKVFFLFSLRLSNFINRLYSLILTLRVIWSAIHISLDAIGTHGGTEAVLRSFAELATFRSEVVRVGEIRTAKGVFWLFTELASFNSEGV